MKNKFILAATLLATQLQAQPLTTIQADFCVKVAQTLQSNAPHTNQFFSPYSLHQALSMAWAGTDAKLGATNHLEMAKALGWDKSTIEQAGESYQKQLALLDSAKHIKLLIANSLWANINVSYRKEFSTQLEKYYHAGVLPFSTETPELQTVAKSMINAWIARCTNNLITNMLDSVPQEAAFYIINAVYFKGDWAYTFDKKTTAKAIFTNWDSSQTQIDMMRQQANFKYAKGADFTAIQLPYRNDEASMYVFLPNPNISMNTWIEGLTGTKLQSYLQIIQQSKSIEISLQLPKFKCSSDVLKMNDVFKALGMTQAFAANSRNFPRIVGAKIGISYILHQTVLEVNEEGAEAAAVTNSDVEIFCPREYLAKAIFKVNRPFFTVILHEPTNAILFAGKFEKM